MSVVSQRVAHLLDGISQRPQELRLSSHLEEQLNGLSHATRGLLKRPGSTHLAKLTDETDGWDRAYLHVIDVSPTEKYYLVIVGGDLRIFDAFTGESLPFSLPDGREYFAIPDPGWNVEFTQDDSGSQTSYWDGTTYTIPSDLKDYRFGPGGKYKWVDSRWPGFGLGAGGGSPAGSGDIKSRALFNGGFSGGLGLLPTDGVYTATRPVDSPDSAVECKFLFHGGYTGAAVGLSLRQQGGIDPTATDDVDWNRYIVYLTEYTTDPSKVIVSLGCGLGGSFGGIGTPALLPKAAVSPWIDPITGQPEPLDEQADNSIYLNRWHKLKFSATTDSGGVVHLSVWVDDKLIIPDTPHGPSGAILDAGFAGVHIRGSRDNFTYPNSLSYPEGTTPEAIQFDKESKRQGTYVDDFKVTSGRSADSPLPIGTGPFFKACTIGDTTIITNTNKIVEAGLAVLPSAKREAIIYIREADYSTFYGVTVDGVSKQVSTTDGNSPASRASLNTDSIASSMLALLAADGTLATAGFVFTQYGSSIHVTKADNSEFTITGKDGLADQGLLIIKGQVQRFEDLPTRAPAGTIAEISGDPGSEYDNYYVVYDDEGAAGREGVWRECAKPGEMYTLNRYTMPWKLVRSTEGFILSACDWTPRKSGSTLTIPFPSFVGQPIKEVFFHEGRLGFTASENIVLSASADMFNLFRKSAKAVYDSDVIDIMSAFQRSQRWHSAIHWDNALTLWSNGAQIDLDGDPSLTPRSVSLRLRTAFENNRDATPLVLGKRIWFAQVVNGRTRVSEYVIPQFTGKPTALDATRDVPGFIEGEPIGFGGTDSPGILAVLSHGARDTLHVHSFQWSADTKQQSSWSKWILPAESKIAALDVADGKLAMIVVHADGTYLETIDIGAHDAGENPLLLDRQIQSSNEHVSAAVEGTETKWTIPYAQAGIVAVDVSTGLVIPTTQPSETEVQTTGDAGDLTGTEVAFGVPFQFRAELSRLFPRKEANGQEVAETGGRLRLGYLTVRNEDSPDLIATVTPQGRAPYTYPNTANVPAFRMPILTRNDQVTIVLTDDGLHGCAITGLDWEGTYDSRSRRI